MRVIDVSKPEKLQRITALSYGPSRSGKTRFAGSWPRPLFLSDATESGWTTLSNMNREVLFEPDHFPIVWAIENAQDMAKAVHQAEPLIKRGEVQTLVIDSLTFYSDLFFNFLENVGGTKDPRQLYQKLAAHLKTIREQIHLLGCNVVWLCLAKDPGEDQPVGGPMLSGQNAAKFAAGCDYLFYHRSFQQNSQSPLQWEVRTRKYQNYAAGGRDEGRLPDPLGYVTSDGSEDAKDIFVPDCTYRTLAEALGILEPNSNGADMFDIPDSIEPVIEQPIVASVADAPPAASAAATNGKGPKTNRPTPPTQASSGRTPSRQ